jgi:AcrR family transcriptional regulator
MSEVVATPTSVDGRALSKRGLKTRARLLEAAEQVFAELGYHDASIVKITEAAGCAQGTFYQYFCGKKEIFEELMRDLNRRVRHAMSEASAQGRTRVEQEQLGFEAFFHFTAKHRALYRIIRQAEFVSPEMLHYHYEKIIEGYAGGLRQAMERGEVAELDPEVLAWALMGIGELIGMKWVLWDGRDELPPDVLESVGKLIRRMLGAEQ